MAERVRVCKRDVMRIRGIQEFLIQNMDGIELAQLYTK